MIFPVNLLLRPKGGLDSELIEVVNQCAKSNWFVAVSNQNKPNWFTESGVKAVFCNALGYSGKARESGAFIAKIIAENEKTLSLQKSQVVILGYGDRDVPMFAHSKSVLIRCDWRTDVGEKMARYGYGIACKQVRELPKVLGLLNEEHPWYFTQQDEAFDTYCLINAATRSGSDEEHKRIAQQVQNCLKSDNDYRKQEFITALASSCYATPAFADSDLWAYYPSSSSANDGSELMVPFVELGRTTFKCRKKAVPLFIRHKATSSRHSGPQEGREDPRSQIESIHIHPEYRGEIDGKTVVVMDDFMNYGTSFCVSAAFLRKAGAKKVLAVAFGKFPRSFTLQEIEILTSPYSPVTKFKVTKRVPQHGTFAPEASEAFKRKFA